MDYFIGGLAGALAGQLVVLIIVLLPLHWIARKIRHRPKKQLRDWLMSWAAGPELLAFGALFELAFRNTPEGQIPVLAAIALRYAGFLIFVIKIITSVVSRFRHRVPALPRE